ncbi:recQ-mediated genome instability protein 1-like [Gigantopelta aegis]|uniref:recQ-mediated genome instability protein 1-like n=1 Tax=Gigantopelta aegis TaxID=1735272 RepID=UPI001B88D4C3|nr:recQ-mediated genome instability protein 1-like [Gigantopelta aegis]XP_041354055.1 recQ-mediated genome instability protein 1-like [Gigantopelta aegis]XP_041354056.1 recQ-mediated genome instability protein 1-like [Gigantopelta aegis]
MNQLDSVHAWLEKSWIKVPHDWIEACLEWIQEQNQGLPLRTDKLNTMVYEQWLMTDLRELSTSCLPLDVATATKLQLSGNYALQVNSCVDVGIPYYGQLQKERGTENANSMVSGEHTTQPAWQPKPSRMLMLKLTDGMLDVLGMEYQHIPQLKNVVPGTKILLQGRVLCRRGVLMLKSDNVQVLGGEVDSLVENNTAENLLTSAMQDNLKHANKSERSEFSGRILASDKSKLKLEAFSQSQKPSYVQHIKKEIDMPPTSVSDRSWPENRLSRLPMNNIKKENGFLTALKAEREAETTKRLQPKPEEYEWSDDMNDLFADDEEDFNMFSDVDTAGRPSNVGISQKHTYSSSSFSSSHRNVLNRNTSESGRFTTEPRKRKENQLDNMFVSSVSLSATSEKRPGSKVNNGDSAHSSEDMLCDFDDDFDMDDLEMIEMSESSANVSPVVSNTNSKIKDKPCSYSVSTAPKREMVLDSRVEIYSNDQHIPSEVKTEPYFNSVSTRDKVPLFSTDNKSDSSLLTKVVNTEPRRSGVCTSQQTTQKDSLVNKSRPNVGQNRMSLPKAVIHPLQVCQPKGTNNNNSQSIIERFLGPHSPVSSSRPAYSTDTEFTYLSEALQEPVAGKTFLIKGYISTLTSKLTSRQGQDWHLSCKINDGSAVAEMDLSNKVLAELIGFSAPDSVIMRQRAKTDKSVKDILTEGLQQCQQRLVDLSCLMEIQFGANTSQMAVQRFIPIEKKHILVLYHRISQLTEK